MSLLILYTFGLGGDGKSYRRGGEFVLNEFLPDYEPESVLYCNYPIQFDPWVDCKGINRPGLVKTAWERYQIPEDEVRRRIQVFPDEVVDSWLSHKRDKDGPIHTPHTYFLDNGIDIDLAHIAIDEIHNFVPASGDPKVAKEWERWLGEIRHEGATIEFLTQEDSKVHATIKGHAHLRLEIESSTRRRDPFFKIPLSEWYSFWTIFGKEYRPSSWQVTKRPSGGKWIEEEAIPFWFKDEIFGVYDTKSKPQSGKGKSGKGRKLPHEKWGKRKLFAWFVKRNWWRFIYNPFSARLAFILFCAIAFANFNHVIEYFQSRLGARKKSRVNQQQVVDEQITQQVQVVSAPQLDVETPEQTEKREQYEHLLSEWLLEQSASSEIVGMTADRVIVGGGEVLRVGDSLRFGLETKQISRIDYGTRKVYFADGGHVSFSRDHGMRQSLAKEHATALQLQGLLRDRRAENSILANQSTDGYRPVR